jgi:endogenous inhibitor of DNA gyrase (YacG/DUF329 family)
MLCNQTRRLSLMSGRKVNPPCSRRAQTIDLSRRLGLCCRG